MPVQVASRLKNNFLNRTFRPTSLLIERGKALLDQAEREGVPINYTISEGSSPYEGYGDVKIHTYSLLVNGENLKLVRKDHDAYGFGDAQVTSCSLCVGGKELHTSGLYYSDKFNSTVGAMAEKAHKIWKGSQTEL